MAQLLLVDDNTQLLDLYKAILEQAGHRVSVADNARDAISLLHETSPEIVVMDLRMPEMEDGLALIRNVVSYTPPARTTPAKIVVISGWAEDLLEAPEKVHVARVLSKPARMEVLLRSISELMLIPLLCLASVRSLTPEHPAQWSFGNTPATLACRCAPVGPQS
ncbi:MAG TPA: response regulator [Bryobacteraceae bacterium]|nr:response regulator [Bryobacteraceae bacterium]